MVVSIDHLVICGSGSSPAGEKGFPAPSIAPADPSAPRPPRQGKPLVLPAQGPVVWALCRNRDYFFLILLFTAICILLPEDNKLWKFSNISQGEACTRCVPRLGFICWEKGVRDAMPSGSRFSPCLPGWRHHGVLSSRKTAATRQTSRELRPHTAQGKAVID